MGEKNFKNKIRLVPDNCYFKVSRARTDKQLPE